MKNNENTGTIRKENHKNWLKFAVTLVVCGLGGAALGYGAAWFADSIPLGGLAESAGQIAKVCVPFAQVPPAPAADPCHRLLAAWRSPVRPLGRRGRGPARTGGKTPELGRCSG